MSTYRDAGVDLDSADHVVDRIGSAVTSTWGPNVVGAFGGFAGGFTLPAGRRDPLLMMSTDGVGTKLEIARRLDRFEGVGADLVAMCVDDLAVAGATPIAFTDYIATGRIETTRIATIVGSIAAACRTAGCALVGGETAEHPGTMEWDAIDLAGTALGVVERDEHLTGALIVPGDTILGVVSPNLRSNGFSLVRHIIRDLDLETAELDGVALADLLLDPSVIYAPAAVAAATAVHGYAHVTGGGLEANLARVLPPGVRAEVRSDRWPVPPIFDYLASLGEVADEEMRRVFNMGIGFVAVTADPDAVAGAFADHGHTTHEIGHIAEA